MTDKERHEIVLGELGRLVLHLGDLREHIKIIGAQVIALEAKAQGGDGLLGVNLPSGPSIDRGFSHDIDLLYEYESGWQAERLTEVLSLLNFKRTRDSRWTKVVDGVTVAIDLLAPPGLKSEELPTSMIPAERGDIVASRVARRLELRIGGVDVEIPVPDAPSFLDLKLGAKELRPARNKDCFDIFAYVNLLGPEEVARQLRQSRRNTEIRRELRQLFGTETSVGVRDVLEFAPTLEEQDRALVVRYILDLFEELLEE